MFFVCVHVGTSANFCLYVQFWEFQRSKYMECFIQLIVLMYLGLLESRGGLLVCVLDILKHTHNSVLPFLKI